MHRKNIFPKNNSTNYKFSVFFPARYPVPALPESEFEFTGTNIGSCSTHIYIKAMPKYWREDLIGASLAHGVAHINHAMQHLVSFPFNPYHASHVMSPLPSPAVSICLTSGSSGLKLFSILPECPRLPPLLGHLCVPAARNCYYDGDNDQCCCNKCPEKARFSCIPDKITGAGRWNSTLCPESCGSEGECCKCVSLLSRMTSTEMSQYGTILQ